MSNGKKSPLFKFKQNPLTGEWEAVPLNISPDEFWDRYVDYTELPFAQWQKWEQEYTYYNEDVLDAIDMVVDEMYSYPEANSIINQIKRNIGGNDDNGVDNKSDQ